MRRNAWVLFCVVLLHVGCVKPTDYSAYLDHMPGSVLVLPPLNLTTEVKASEAFLSTMTRPLAESGYYVFPMALVDQMLKENGLPTPGEMHQVSLEKLGEVFGADSVLYIVIKDWKTQYVVISSSTQVTLEYRLVDIDTGQQLWHFNQTIREGRGGLSIQGLVEAATYAVVSAATDRARDLAVIANATAFENPNHGLLKGRRHPGFEEDQRRRQTEREKLQAENAGG